MKRLALIAVLTLLPRTALATNPIGVGAPIEAPPSTTGLEPGNRRSYWSRGEHRFYVSSMLDAGYLYGRPQIAVGFGKPNWRFMQLETWATLSAAGAGQYQGLRFGLPFAELRGGARYQIPLSRLLYLHRETYTRFDLEDKTGPSARYLALDTEFAATIPFIGGSIFTLFGTTYVSGLKEGYDVYEEQLRIVGTGPWFHRARIGYALRLGEQGAIRIGPVVDTIYNPGRKMVVVRAGLVATVVMTHHLEVLATFVPTIVSPDAIGLAGGDFGQLGIRYRWATPAPPKDPSEQTEP